MLEEIKADVDRLLLVPKMEKSLVLAKYIVKFFTLTKLKVFYLRPFLSTNIFKNLEVKFYVLWTQTKLIQSLPKYKLYVRSVANETILKI